MKGKKHAMSRRSKSTPKPNPKKKETLTAMTRRPRKRPSSSITPSTPAIRKA